MHTSDLQTMKTLKQVFYKKGKSYRHICKCSGSDVFDRVEKTNPDEEWFSYCQKLTVNNCNRFFFFVGDNCIVPSGYSTYLETSE